jgi:SAM-dependent methyltransferase
MSDEKAKSYEAHTKLHYQDPATAEEYAVRQSWRRSPAEWVIGRLEIRQINAGLRLVGAGASSVVDIPAGSGKLTALLSGRYPRYIAADISAEIMQFIPVPVPKTRTDVTSLPFADQALDLVVCLRLLHRVPEDVVDGAIAEGLRVARQGYVFSYASHPRNSTAATAARVGTGRDKVWTTQLTPEQVKAKVEERGGVVVRDRSISFGLTTERVAVCRPAAGAGH